MAFDLVNELNKKLGINDKRLVLGIFLPTVIELIIFYKIWNKQLPSGATDLGYIIFFSILVSLFINEISPQLCWYFTTLFGLKSYKNYLKDNIDAIFVDIMKKKLEENNIQVKSYKNKVIDTLVDIEKRAKNDYLENYFFRSDRLLNTKLMLKESKFILIFIGLIYLILDLIFIIRLSNGSIRILDFQRDQIIEFGSTLIIIFMILIVISIVFSIYYGKLLRIEIFKSINGPSVRNSDETGYREDVFEARKLFLNNFREEKDKQILDELLKGFYVDEYLQILKDTIIRNIFKRIFEKYNREIVNEDENKLNKEVIETLSLYATLDPSSKYYNAMQLQLMAIEMLKQSITKNEFLYLEYEHSPLSRGTLSVYDAVIYLQDEAYSPFIVIEVKITLNNMAISLLRKYLIELGLNTGILMIAGDEFKEIKIDIHTILVFGMKNSIEKLKEWIDVCFQDYLEKK